MTGRRRFHRAAPVVAGLAGIGWVWAELLPQREGFQDTDDPAVSLQFLAAFPGGWTQAGLLLGLAAFALLATVLLSRRDLAPASGRADEQESVWPSFVAVTGVLASAFLLCVAIIRLGGGPLLYVRDLNQQWGEAAYLVTQFVGVHLFGVGGLLLLSIWIAGYSWLGARRGTVPSAIALLALLPLLRFILPALGWAGFSLDGLWPIYMVAIPASWFWLILLGLVGTREAAGDPVLDAA